MSGLERNQALATDPQAHASLSASAGTGKTHVLTSRVFRLLLGGAAPESILCLTFTKAGAAAMASRIGERLSRWVRLDRYELAAELQALGGPGNPEQQALARQLFARVLDAPGGVRIQTIHAFAQSLLAAFPAEAGVPPGLKPIEGRAGQELVMRTLADLLADADADADRGGDVQLIGDVAALSGRLGEKGAVDYLKHCASYAGALVKLDPGEIDGLVRGTLDLPDCDIDEFLADHCADDKFDCSLLRALAAANRSWTPTTGGPAADVIEAWLALDPRGRASGLEGLRKVFLTDKQELRKRKPPTTGYDEQASAVAQTIVELLAIQKGCALAADIAAGLRAGRAFALAYAEAKWAAGVADFDDLIDWTRGLLEQAGMADWVRFKLDQRIDHLLVDEAQDTNADQWAIVKALVADFFTGAAEAESRWRTLLTVGDFKQAIYGFQGTDPREFEKVRADFRMRAETLVAAETESGGEGQARNFHDLAMATSFRSGQGVLDAVDAVIARVGFEAMGLPEAPEPHKAADKNAHLGASVELWPPFAPDSDRDDNGDEEGWIDLRERHYATRLAAEVKAWIDSGDMLGSTGQPIRPGDIMILVRSRAQLASLIVARLFAAGVPVAGIDRLHLNEPLAVQDLLAAMAFAVQPLDDLNLANLLVSPLVGWSQDQLMALAAGRKGRLWPALRALARTDAEAAKAQDLLASLLGMADLTTPARFLETVLTGPIEGRRKLAHRLGMESRDPIDELMTSALEYERDDIPSLERFIAWFRRGDVEIARDASAPANEVRVMTVHGAKGLEAPVVILADAHFDPLKVGRRNTPVDIGLGGVEVPVVRPRKDERNALFENLIAAGEQAELEEHWRLLYVAMTRAKERLVIGGLQPKRGEMSALSWHVAVGNALGDLGAAEREHERWGMVRRFERVGTGPAPRSTEVQEKSGVAAAVPAWARAPAPAEEVPPRPLAPSAIAKDDVAAPPPTPAMRAAAERGTWIHALLERLVEVDPERRRAVAEQWLDQSAGLADADARTEIAGQVCGILSNPDFEALFGPGSLGEAPLAATLPDGRVIAGTMDRLLVEEARVSVIDFKTGRVPAGPGSIPPAHLAQMQAYADALKVIFPGRAIRSALLYTAGPALFELGVA